MSRPRASFQECLKDSKFTSNKNIIYKNKNDIISGFNELLTKSGAISIINYTILKNKDACSVKPVETLTLQIKNRKIKIKKIRADKPEGIIFEDQTLRTLDEGVYGGFFGTTDWDTFKQEANKHNTDNNPLFSVISHNSAHHMSCFLAINAFPKEADLRKRALINFDAHSDFSGGSGRDFVSELIDCQSWGKHLINEDFLKYYINIGMCSRDRKRLNTKVNDIDINKNLDFTTFNKKSGKTIIPIKTSNIEDNMKTIITKIQKEEENLGLSWKDFDVYVTVDRDFMKGSCTPYGDGSYDISDGRYAVFMLLGILAKAGANLVGFDVTGLPCGSEFNQISPFPYRTDISDKQNSDFFVWGMEDIKFFFLAVKRHYDKNWQAEYFDMSSQLLHVPFLEARGNIESTLHSTFQRAPAK